MSPSTLLELTVGPFRDRLSSRAAKAFSLAGGPSGIRQLHSRPTYYGMLTALWCGIPALFVFAFWLAFQDAIITHLVVVDLPEKIRNLPAGPLNLVVNDIRNLVSGNIVSGTVSPALQAAADHYNSLRFTANAALSVCTLSLAVCAMVFVRARITPKTRARNHVEKIILIALIACSSIAIFTTIGIVLSVLYEAIRFFKQIPLHEFLLVSSGARQNWPIVMILPRGLLLCC